MRKRRWHGTFFVMSERNESIVAQNTVQTKVA
jgi:hypothetical protein